MTADDLLDPMIGPGFKGFPHGHAPLRRSAVAQAGWNVLAGDLPLPVAVLKRDALAHNVAWMQASPRVRAGPGAARQDDDVAAAVPAPARRRRLGHHLRHRHQLRSAWPPACGVR
jgi:hypothetical protein